MKKQLYQALLDLYNDYKCLADSGDAGNWRLEDTDVGQKALEAIEAYEDSTWKDWSGGVCPFDKNIPIKVKLRNGETVVDYSLEIRWNHHGYGSDIVKYKLIKKGE